MDIRKKKYLITNSFFDRSFKNFIFKVMFKTNELFIFLRKLTVVDLSKKVFYFLGTFKKEKNNFLSLSFSPAFSVSRFPRQQRCRTRARMFNSPLTNGGN